MLVNKLFAGMIAITISVNWMVYVAADDADTSIAKRYLGIIVVSVIDTH